MSSKKKNNSMEPTRKIAKILVQGYAPVIQFILDKLESFDYNPSHMSHLIFYKTLCRLLTNEELLAIIDVNLLKLFVELTVFLIRSVLVEFISKRLSSESNQHSIAEVVHQVLDIIFKKNKYIKKHVGFTMELMQWFTSSSFSKDSIENERLYLKKELVSSLDKIPTCFEEDVENTFQKKIHLISNDNNDIDNNLKGISISHLNRPSAPGPNENFITPEYSSQSLSSSHSSKEDDVLEKSNGVNITRKESKSNVISLQEEQTFNLNNLSDLIGLNKIDKSLIAQLDLDSSLKKDLTILKEFTDTSKSKDLLSLKDDISSKVPDQNNLPNELPVNVHDATSDISNSISVKTENMISLSDIDSLLNKCKTFLFQNKSSSNQDNALKESSRMNALNKSSKMSFVEVPEIVSIDDIDSLLKKCEAFFCTSKELSCSLKSVPNISVHTTESSHSKNISFQSLNDYEKGTSSLVSHVSDNKNVTNLENSMLEENNIFPMLPANVYNIDHELLQETPMEVDNDLDPKLDSDADPKVEVDIEKNLDQTTETNIDQNVENNIDQNIEKISDVETCNLGSSKKFNTLEKSDFLKCFFQCNCEIKESPCKCLETLQNSIWPKVKENDSDDNKADSVVNLFPRDPRLRSKYYTSQLSLKERKSRNVSIDGNPDYQEMLQHSQENTFKTLPAQNNSAISLKVDKVSVDNHFSGSLYSNNKISTQELINALEEPIDKENKNEFLQSVDLSCVNKGKENDACNTYQRMSSIFSPRIRRTNSSDLSKEPITISPLNHEVPLDLSVSTENEKKPIDCLIAQLDPLQTDSVCFDTPLDLTCSATNTLLSYDNCSPLNLTMNCSVSGRVKSSINVKPNSIPRVQNETLFLTNHSEDDSLLSYGTSGNTMKNAETIQSSCAISKQIFPKKLHDDLCPETIQAETYASNTSSDNIKSVESASSPDRNTDSENSLVDSGNTGINDLVTEETFPKTILVKEEPWYQEEDNYLDFSVENNYKKDAFYLDSLFSFGCFNIEQISSSIFAFSCNLNYCKYETQEVKCMKNHIYINHKNPNYEWTCQYCNQNDEIDPSLAGLFNHALMHFDISDISCLSKRNKSSIRSITDFVDAEPTDELIKSIQFLSDSLCIAKFESASRSHSSQLSNDKSSKSEMIEVNEYYTDLFKCMFTNCFYSCSDVYEFEKHCKDHITAIASESSQGLVNCHYCNESTISQSEHILSKHGSSVYQCPLCLYRAYSIISVAVHLTCFHSPQDIVSAPLVLSCSKKYRFKVNAFTSNLEFKPFRCFISDCNYTSHIISRYVDHLKSHSVITLNCFECNARIPTLCQFFEHLLLHDIGKYHCLYCYNAYNDANHAAIHVGQAHQDYPCKLVVRCDYFRVKEKGSKFFQGVKPFKLLRETLTQFDVDSLKVKNNLFLIVETQKRGRIAKAGLALRDIRVGHPKLNKSFVVRLNSALPILKESREAIRDAKSDSCCDVVTLHTVKEEMEFDEYLHSSCSKGKHGKKEDEFKTDEKAPEVKTHQEKIIRDSAYISLYKCFICWDELFTLQGLKDHFASHHKRSPVKMDISFDLLPQKEVPLDLFLACYYCNIVLFNERDMKTHHSSCHGGNKLKYCSIDIVCLCPFCDQVFNFISEVARHCFNNHKRIYPCDFCDFWHDETCYHIKFLEEMENKKSSTCSKPACPLNKEGKSINIEFCYGQSDCKCHNELISSLKHMRCGNKLGRPLLLNNFNQYQTCDNNNSTNIKSRNRRAKKKAENLRNSILTSKVFNLSKEQNKMNEIKVTKKSTSHSASCLKKSKDSLNEINIPQTARKSTCFRKRLFPNLHSFFIASSQGDTIEKKRRKISHENDVSGKSLELKKSLRSKDLLQILCSSSPPISSRKDKSSISENSVETNSVSKAPGKATETSAPVSEMQKVPQTARKSTSMRCSIGMKINNCTSTSGSVTRKKPAKNTSNLKSITKPTKCCQTARKSTCNIRNLNMNSSSGTTKHKKEQCALIETTVPTIKDKKSKVKKKSTKLPEETSDTTLLQQHNSFRDEPEVYSFPLDMICEFSSILDSVK